MAVEHSQELSQMANVKHYLAAKLDTVVPKDFLERRQLHRIYELLQHHENNINIKEHPPAIESAAYCTELFNNLTIDGDNSYQALIKGLRDVKLDKPADVLEKRGVVVKAEVTYKNSAETKTHEKLLVELNTLSQCLLPFDEQIEKYSKQLKDIDVFILDAMPINGCYSRMILWLWCRSSNGVRSLEVMHGSGQLLRILAGLFKHLQNSASKRIEPKCIVIDCKEFEKRILNDPSENIDIRNAEDILVCSICRELFEDPRTLPCLHTFCHNCLTRHCKEFLDAGLLMCPICRKEHPLQSNTQFPKNFLIERLMFRLGLMNTVPSSSKHSEIDIISTSSEDSVWSIAPTDTKSSSSRSVSKIEASGSIPPVSKVAASGTASSCSDSKLKFNITLQGSCSDAKRIENVRRCQTLVNEFLHMVGGQPGQQPIQSIQTFPDPLQLPQMQQQLQHQLQQLQQTLHEQLPQGHLHKQPQQQQLQQEQHQQLQGQQLWRLQQWHQRGQLQQQLLQQQLQGQLYQWQQLQQQQLWQLGQVQLQHHWQLQLLQGQQLQGHLHPVQQQHLFLEQQLQLQHKQQLWQQHYLEHLLQWQLYQWLQLQGQQLQLQQVQQGQQLWQEQWQLQQWPSQPLQEQLHLGQLLQQQQWQLGQVQQQLQQLQQQR